MNVPEALKDSVRVMIDYTSANEELVFIGGTFFRILPDGETLKRFRYASDSMRRKEVTPGLLASLKLEWSLHADNRIKNL